MPRAPGVTVSESSLTVTEQDTAGDSYTVVLGSQPTADVVVTVAGHAGTEVLPAPTTLTFTTVNWETARTVTVTAGNDSDTTDDTVTLTHSAASTDSDYNGIMIGGVTVMVEDNDTAKVTGVTVESGNAQLTVGWDAVGNATGYRVQWKSGGQGYNTNRQATIASGSTTSHTISSLANGTEYTLRVKADRTDANSGPWSDNATGMPAVPTAPGVTLSKTALTVTEEDTTGDSYTVVLDTLPTASVTVTVAGHAGTDVTVSPASLTFTTVNWETAQEVTVTATDDADTADGTVTLTHGAASTDGDYSGITIADVTVTVEDNDTAQVTGVTVESGNAQLTVGWDAVGNATGYRVQWKSGGQGYNTNRQATIASGSTTSHTISSLANGTEYTLRVKADRTDANDGPWSDNATGMPAVPTAPGVTLSKTALTVTEEDTTGDSYTVVLDTLPTASVTVTVAGHAGTEVTVSPASLTFTTVNWETAQAVTVTATDDADTADGTVTLTHGAASTDSDYSGITITDVTVTVEDNDTAQVTGVMVESGNAQLTVGWDAVGNATGYRVQWKSGGQSYNTNRQATIASGSTTSHTISSLANGTEYTLRVKADRTDANSGPWSDNATGMPAVPTAPGVTLSESSLTVTEEDTTGDSYTVVLDTLPTASVTVTVAGHAGTDVTVSPASLTFTTVNWETAQAVTVTADNDADTTDDTATLTHGAASTDSDYGGIAIADVTVMVEDNDTAQVTGVTVESGNAQLTVGWDAVGNATGYRVQWKSGGQSYNTNRQATIASGSTTSHTISSLANGTEYTLRVKADRTGANSGPWSDDATGMPAVPTAPGVTLSKSSLTVTEEDTTGDSYTVVLDTLPTASVTVTVAGHAGTDVTVSPASLTFTTVNWETAQAVTVTADNDADTTDDTVTLTHSAASTDSDYGGIAIAGVTVTVADDDSANRAPEFDDGASTTRTLSETGGSTPLTIGSPVGHPVAASDADGDPLEYSLEGADAGRFTVAPGTGQIRTLANTVYDYEVRQSYSVVVNVEDGNGASETIDVTLEVENQLETPRTVSPPTVTTLGTTSLRVNWTAPENVGRPAITGYDVRHVKAGVDDTRTQRVTGTSVTLTDLEPDTRYFVYVKAVNADGPSTNWSIAKIVNTAPVLVTFGASSYTATEGGAAATVTVELSQAMGSSTTIPLTPTNRAGATDADYSGVPPNVTFGASQTSTTFTVTAVDDDDDDDGESVRIGFGPLPSGVAAGSPATATVALHDDDGWEPPTVSFGAATYTATEGGGAVTVTVEVDRAEVPFTLRLTRDGQGGATSSDYSGVPSSVVFRGSDTAKSFTVTAVDDAVDDDGESVVIGIGTPLPEGLSLRIGSPSEARVRLVDNDVREASGALRLAQGGGVYGGAFGRLQVYHDGQWGLVCEGKFGREAAQVACRQLGFAGGEEGYGGAGSGGLPFWLKDVKCDGTESRLVDCLHRGLQEHYCASSDIAGVECSEMPVSIADAYVEGALLTLRYDAALDGGSVPSGDDFVVLAGVLDDASAVPVTAVSVDGDAVALTLARPVLPEETVRLSYLVTPMHPVQDAKGRAAAPLTDLAVRNAPRVSAPAADAVDLVADPGEVSVLPAEADLAAALPAPVDLSPWLADGGASAPLGRLDLSSLSLSDIGTLAGLTELRVLNLGDNAIADLAPLSGLTGLRVLDLSSNTVADVGPLAGLTGLERLDLSGNRIADVSALWGLTDLEVLLLDGNRIDDVVPLWSLQGLVHLSLADNRIADVDLLAGLRSLQRLDLGGNRVSDVSPLSDLSKLVWLRLPGNPVADADPLGRLMLLRWLWLDTEVAGRGLLDAHARASAAPLWIDRGPAQERKDAR